MDADWITSPNARRVLQHEDDPRPAWLWSQDGETLIWHNQAATLFMAKIKKHGLKRPALAAPIKGQIARTIRLGSFGRTSLSRMRFLIGEKPASTTCACTPLHWQDGRPVLLVVGVDPIDSAILAAAEAGAEPAIEAIPDEADTPEAEVPEADAKPVIADPIAEAIVADEMRAIERELDNWREVESEEPAAPSGENEPEAEPEPSGRLSALVDRLSEGDGLYAPLTEADDEAPRQLFRITGHGFTARPVEPQHSDAETELGDLARLDERMDAEPAIEDETPTAASLDEVAEALNHIAPEIETRPVPPAESAERVSRYNFDELSRILNDRVGEQRREAAQAPNGGRSGALINLGGETLVLNRLPLGILVFRDQQILFANRAITEMVGYDSVEDLRNAGLAAVFPAAGPEEQGAGPINHLVQRDGTLMPVTARLQSISWQGKPALMLSASMTEVRTGHEAAVRAFAEMFAGVRGDGFFETNRTGVISTIDARAVAMLGLGETEFRGRPLSSLIAPQEAPALHAFLERPARFAETARPTITLRSAGSGADIELFALGQAGVITGYFGLVHHAETPAPARIAARDDVEPALLARISRGVRRPLNSIIGFADLIHSETFGKIGNERYESYAEDIRSAGLEIRALVDELDDYTRLKDGRYLPQRATLDLLSLLENCVLRIRQQASAARVIVRSAISETLPKVTADQASLTQAVLNLLASAIDQTPTGGAVVISAQREDDGGISIHVRDSSNTAVDMAERFVVFREGVGRNGQMLAPVRSSVGLALTRSLLAVNAVSLSVDPAGQQGMLFSLLIPADLVDKN